MSAIQNYLFNNMGRIGADSTDNTQQAISNTKFANYMLTQYTNEVVSDSHVQFATQQPTLMFGSTVHGGGLSGSVIDNESNLFNNVENVRPLEKLQLYPRPFLTVPYLGRGGGNPSLESQLQQGEIVNDKKSVSTMSEVSFSDYMTFNSDSKMTSRIANPANSIQELVMDGWVRGGAASREMTGN
jgi:hypothetical protein